MGTPAPRQAVSQAIPVRPTVWLPYEDSKRSPSFKIFRAAFLFEGRGRKACVQPYDSVFFR
ncbi:hypothetical protein GK2797 [Geobacillus kaustophilus HTA426]|uniref:Uncharacterized protein n=1 Tax=Geobacillus kaustophilus (strain HTA426) TaxID=235909 RepID=Q5KW54_GEOKA|nr:hypothetical protein GK2797 [Geobacillus kaustophilus HTA426]